MLGGYLYFDDFVELWIKLRQRGLTFILSKFTFIAKRRTISAFSNDFIHANWWIIPYLQKRRNLQITGNTETEYEEYISQKYIRDQQKVLVSLGCGEGNHEIKLAQLNPNLKIIAYDISQKLIDKANKRKSNLGLQNITFETADVYELSFKEESIDYFLFNASLHHFKNIKEFVSSKIKPALNKSGLVIINEYVGPNRLNLPDEQINYCNQCLREIVSLKNRKILHLNMIKSRCYRLGKLRMILSDPSECTDSESILPVLRSAFEEIEFKKLGGNILMPVLKHISHHFIDNNLPELLQIIQKEEEYLKTKDADFVFAIYQNKKP